MYPLSSFPSFIAISILALSTFIQAIPPRIRRGTTPRYPFDPSTATACTYWVDNDGEISCNEVPVMFTISMNKFIRLNPSLAVPSRCENWHGNQSYCVAASNDPGPFVLKTRANTTTTTSAPSSTGNGVPTPLPTQPGMINNCNKFHFVEKDEGCSTLTSRYGISFSQLLSWNPAIGSNCETLWANVNVCVGIIGATQTPTPPPTSSTPSPTSTGNGIATPVPTQPGMVPNCNKFYFVNRGDGCAVIASSNSISLSQFLSWNPSVGETCTGMWANAYVCVSVIGFMPTPTATATPTRTSTTTTGNSVATPTPTQVGMTPNCKRFHFVKKDETCEGIAREEKIAVGDFVRWNPVAGSDCTGLWANTWACVGLL